MFFSIAARMNLEIEQLDVKLHGELEEEIYIQQSEGFEVKEKKNLVCRLRKSLYCFVEISLSRHREPSMVLIHVDNLNL